MGRHDIASFRTASTALQVLNLRAAGLFGRPATHQATATLANAIRRHAEATSQRGQHGPAGSREQAQARLRAQLARQTQPHAVELRQ